VLEELPCVHYAMLALGGAVPVAPYRTFGTRELAEGVTDALAGKTAALMANHGAVAYGEDLASALDRTVLLEWACDVYSRAAALGQPRALGPAEQQAVVESVIERGYGTLKPAGEQR
jgi:L-fuculose-phosphate aldolase